MKKRIAYIFLSFLLICVSYSQNPIGKQKYEQNDRSVRISEKQSQVNYLIPPSSKSDLNPEEISKLLKKNGAYSLQQLSAMKYQGMVDLLVTLNWYDIIDLFDWTEGAKTFYGDKNRIDFIINAIEKKGNEFSKNNNKGIPTLIEVIRSGLYITFYNSDPQTNYLRDRSYHDSCIPSILSIITNPEFKLGSSIQDDLVNSVGLYIANASVNTEILEALIPIMQDFNNNIKNYLGDRKKIAAIYQIGSSITYDLRDDFYYYNPQQATSIFKGKINSFLNEIYSIAKYGSLSDQYEYLINNAVYWTGQLSVFENENKSNQVLTEVIDIYGKWVMASVEAVRMIVENFNGVDFNGNPVNLNEVKSELKAQLLPKITTFDKGKIVFNYGGKVDEEKIKKLYWAQKEVRSQFFRLIQNDEPIEQGNADDILNIVIFNSPKEYEFNRIINNLSTNNGGLYIEGQGTFYTYERTQSESIYTLEDLFRHEFTHYMQGRYLEPGLWGGKLHSNDRLTWFDEGQAEFYAGSTRYEGVSSRKAMVENISFNKSERMTLPEVLSATYSSGFKFYTYAFVFIDYLYNKNIKILFDLIELIKKNDAGGYDLYITGLKNNSELCKAYNEHLEYLMNNSNSYSNIVTSEDYLIEHSKKSTDEIVSEIKTFGLFNDVKTKIEKSNDYEIITLTSIVEGELSISKVGDWLNMSHKTDDLLKELNNQSWEGYKTFNCYSKNYSVSNNFYKYEIVFQGLSTANEITSVNVSADKIPLKYKLNNAYPNPFNPSTNLSFSLPQASKVRLTIFNSVGEVINKLVDGKMFAEGTYTYKWNGTNQENQKVSSGIYFYTLDSEDYRKTKKMILMK